MKIIEKIEKAQAEGRICWSFEYFPPKTEQGIQNLFSRIDRMREMGPEFIDVTWGAGGSTSDATLQICSEVTKYVGLETCMHLTCTNMEVDKINHALKVCKENGIQNILALRGDPPRGQERWTAVEGGFSHACDLVKYIREQFDDYFGIGVAGYPEGHTECTSLEDDIKHLKAKIDAGGEFIVTQLFYDVELFINWAKRCREAGINCPIVPGLMPINTYAGWKKIITLSKTIVPPKMAEELEAIQDDDEAVKEYGVNYLVNMVQTMIKAGFKEFHFYTLNLEKATHQILERLGFVAPIENVRPLPWKKSAGKREKETVRPIFWANRPKSYLDRTESWDEFPNGRWGDSRSPAFGEMESWRALHLPEQNAINYWGHPENLEEVSHIFVRYLSGEIPALPWCHVPLGKETSDIKEKIIALNKKGVFTINSQPAVNGLPSSHKVHGWGGAGGYVYQKAYLEFFIHPDQFEMIIEDISKYTSVTYYATSEDSDVSTNCQRKGNTSALTWGVFPGSEIIQPTIINIESFRVWKEEAFELWKQWQSLYPEGSKPAQLLEKIRKEYVLVNVVDNNFIDGDLFAIFNKVA